MIKGKYKQFVSIVLSEEFEGLELNEGKTIPIIKKVCANSLDIYQSQ